MGTANISGIGNMFMQGQTSGVAGDAKEQKLTADFSEVMSQMTSLAGNGFAAGNQTAGVDIGTDRNSAAAAETGSDFYGNHGVKIQDSQRAEVKQDELSEKAEKFADDVKEVLKEELGVSEEQIEETMAVLGLEFSDLLNPNQLAAFVAELTGTEDMGALLCSGEFVTVLKEVEALGEDLLKELGVTSEEFAQMLHALQKVQNPESAENTAFTEAGEQMLAEPVMDAAETAEMGQAADKPADVSVTEEVSESTEGSLFVNEKTQEKEQSGEEKQSEMADDKEGTGAVENDTKDEVTFSRQQGQQQGQQTAGDTGAHAEHHMAGTANQNVTENTFVQAQGEVSQTTSQVDVADIMRQIAEYSKVAAGKQATTIEMQLNPQNLGKLYMEVTSKNGEVSAHITAQNEVVKEALENQLLELRQNLNQAGIKVEAVEVTVGSHEFERNLEQNAKQQEDQAAEQEKSSKQTRRINLSDLDELGGLMTEEENLVAQMMADQGNSIDYTA